MNRTTVPRRPASGRRRRARPGRRRWRPRRRPAPPCRARLGENHNAMPPAASCATTTATSPSSGPASRRGISFSCTTLPLSSPLASTTATGFPPAHVAGGRLGGDLPDQHEIGAGRVVLQHRAEAGSWLLICRASAASPSPGAPCTPLKNTRAGRFVRLVGSLCRRAASMRLSSEAIWGRRPRTRAATSAARLPRRRWERGLLGGALVLAGRVLHGEHRHHVGAVLAAVATSRQSPSRGGPANAGISCDQQAEAMVAPKPRLGDVRQHSRGRRHRQPGRRRLRELAGRAAGIALERPRQGAAAPAGRQQQEKNSKERRHSRPGERSAREAYQHRDIGHGKQPQKARCGERASKNTTPTGLLSASSFRPHVDRWRADRAPDFGRRSISATGMNLR